MDDEIKNLELDRPGRGKSVDQIKKHTVDIGLENKPIDRSIYLLTKGDDVQKFSVLQTLPQLLELEPKATVARLIPKILQELPNSSCEFHVMCSKVFRVLIENKVQINLLNAVLQGIESWDPIVANAWMDTLVGVIEFLNEVQIKAEILPLAHSKSLLTMPAASRISSCRILGKVAVHKTLNVNDVKRDVLPLVQSLCQDCNAEVRAVICAQLPSIAHGLGNDSARESLMVCLVELASDDIAYVKAAAVGIIVKMFSYATSDAMKSTVLPLVIQICSHIMTTDDISVINISREFGNLLEGLKPCMSHSDSMWFLNCYKTLSHRGLTSGPFQFRSVDINSNVVCRENSAANLPTVSKFVLSILQGQTDILYSIIHDLASDPCYLVRQMVANCFLDLTRVFGVQCKGLKTEFVRLLRDDSEEVLEKIVPHISGVLQVFCRYALISPEIINPNSADIGRAMLKCYFDLANGYNWRLLQNFLLQLECMPSNVPPDYIHQHFTPVVLTCAVHGKGKPVKMQAARTLLIFLRFNKKEMQRRWLRENMISQLCYSPSSYTRLVFIKLCQSAIDLFSEKYFKQYFFECLLVLADDPVPNVRLCVASMFPTLKQMLILPTDRALHENLESIFVKYKNEEKDKDVIDVYEKQIKAIISPNKSFDREAHAKEQKRRQTEEDELYDARPIGSNQPVNSTRRAITPRKARNSFSQESAPSRTQSQIRPSIITSEQGNSKMPFLEQSFFTDAGISIQTTVSKQIVNIGENQFPLFNITDDDKVTLREATKNKRLSSILPTTCLENTPKSFYRRSLNIETKRISKIPISSNYSKSISPRNEDEIIDNKTSNTLDGDDNSVTVEHDGAHKSSSNLPSYLPVFERRARSEMRKTT